MITNQKRFGSYVVANPNDLFIETDVEYNSNDRVSTCSLPPVWIDLTLTAIRKYNDDTSIFRFQLPEGAEKLNLPFGSFLLIRIPNKDGEDAIRPYTSISDNDDDDGSFEILVKRYDSWGVKESKTTHFLFTKTDHSYRPPGVASNYIHQLNLGDTLSFKHTRLCLGKVRWPLPGTKTLTMIAVGAGIAPMIQMLRKILKSRPPPPPDSSSELLSLNFLPPPPIDHVAQLGIERVVLLYGVRHVRDILLREVLDEWEGSHPHIFKVVYCVGSRWANIHMGAKLKSKDIEEYLPPPIPEGFERLQHACIGWVNEAAISTYAFPPSPHTKVLVCGLPGVYEKLCGSRFIPEVDPYSTLGKLGYDNSMVIKL